MQHISHTPLLHSSFSTSTSLLLLAINKNKTAWYTRIFWSISKCNFPFNYTKLNSVQHTRAINFTGLEARIKNDNNLVKLIASVWVRQSNLFLNPFIYLFFCSFIFLIHLRTLFNYFANHICRRIKINWREICIFIEHLLSDGWLADFHQPLWFSCIHKKKTSSEGLEGSTSGSRERSEFSERENVKISCTRAPCSQLQVSSIHENFMKF